MSACHMFGHMNLDIGGAQWKTLPRQIVRCIWASTMEENRAWWKTGDEKCWACVREHVWKKTNKVNPCCLAFKTILICSKRNLLCLIPPAYSRCVMVQAFLGFFCPVPSENLTMHPTDADQESLDLRTLGSCWSQGRNHTKLKENWIMIMVFKWL